MKRPQLTAKKRSLIYDAANGRSEPSLPVGLVSQIELLYVDDTINRVSKQTFGPSGNWICGLNVTR